MSPWRRGGNREKRGQWCGDEAVGRPGKQHWPGLPPAAATEEAARPACPLAMPVSETGRKGFPPQTSVGSEWLTPGVAWRGRPPPRGGATAAGDLEACPCLHPPQRGRRKETLLHKVYFSPSVWGRGDSSRSGLEVLGSQVAGGTQPTTSRVPSLAPARWPSQSRCGQRFPCHLLYQPSSDTLVLRG